MSSIARLASAAVPRCTFFTRLQCVVGKGERAFTRGGSEGDDMRGTVPSKNFFGNV